MGLAARPTSWAAALRSGLGSHLARPPEHGAPGMPLGSVDAHLDGTTRPISSVVPVTDRSLWVTSGVDVGVAPVTNRSLGPLVSR